MSLSNLLLCNTCQNNSLGVLSWSVSSCQTVDQQHMRRQNSRGRVKVERICCSLSQAVDTYRFLYPQGTFLHTHSFGIFQHGCWPFPIEIVASRSILFLSLWETETDTRTFVCLLLMTQDSFCRSTDHCFSSLPFPFPITSTRDWIQLLLHLCSQK